MQDTQLAFDWETLVNEGIEARKMGDQSAWCLGDLALKVASGYGEGGLEKYAKRIGTPHMSLVGYRWVSKRFPENIRGLINLSYGHFQAVAALPDAESWLKKALANGWSIERLRAELKFLAIHSSESNEWYTPSRYIDAARAVMGEIDLDPASHAVANETVGATRFYDLEADGLKQPWSGRIWLNPPYGTETGRFVSRLLEGVQDGEVSEAVCLVNSHATDTDWFQGLWDALLCFTDHRIDFARSSDKENGASPTHGNVFAYFGPNHEAFRRVFQEFGAIVTKVSGE